jgi:hypothetical protein
MTERRTARIPIAGEFQLAGYFIMAHWPEEMAGPQIEVSTPPLVFMLDLDGPAMAALKRLLTELPPNRPLLAKSAMAWRKELESHGIDFSSPDSGA